MRNVTNAPSCHLLALPRGAHSGEPGKGLRCRLTEIWKSDPWGWGWAWGILDCWTLDPAKTQGGPSPQGLGLRGNVSRTVGF